MKKLLISSIIVLQMTSPLAIAAPEVPTSPGALSCEARRPLTLQQKSQLNMFRIGLTHLDSLRSGPDARGMTYERKLSEIMRKHQAVISSDVMGAKAGDFIINEQLRQALHNTIGLNNKEFQAFERIVREIQSFNGMSPRYLTRATVRLQKRVWNWMNDGGGVIGSGPGQDGQRLQVLARGQVVLKLIDLNYRSLIRNITENREALEDQLALYRQLGLTIFGGGAVAGSIIAASPIVAGASATVGTVGVLAAGCGIGAMGGGAAALLQRQYDIYSLAYYESIRRNTSFSCEVRKQVAKGGGDRIRQDMQTGLYQGALAGCVLSTMGLASKRTVDLVLGSVVLASSIEVAQGTYSGVMATKSYLIYQSLLSYQRAEAASDQDNLAAAQVHLEEARMHARKAGAHALNLLLTGIVLVGVRAERQRAFASGTAEIVVLISKSSDNAAVAVQLLSDSVQSIFGAASSQ